MPFVADMQRKIEMIRKFMTTVALGSLFVGGLAASHLAFAQPGEGPGDGPRGPRAGLMAMADANKDGKLTKAELTAALEARFARLDVDKDGKLTAKDRDALRQQRLDARFAELDTNHDGQISKAEFAAGYQARAQMGEEAGKGPRDHGRGGPGDRGPGDHGPGDRGPGRGMMHGGADGFGGPRDGDRDSTLTKAEFMARPLAMFDKADSNKDGVVTTDEMKAAHQAMRGADHDRKGPPPPPRD